MLTGPGAVQVVAWDFEGVLNRNVENGVFAWSRNFERDLGLSLHSFRQFLFGGRFQQAMVGEACLVELVTQWTEENDAHGRTEEILGYWFAQDNLPDAETLGIVSALKARGVRNVMATNNEIHRTAYIETDMGFHTHVDRIFAAGRMKVAKPDHAYFAHIASELDIAPERILLVDDLQENIEAAEACGWKAFHFTNGSHGALTEALGLTEA